MTNDINHIIARVLSGEADAAEILQLNDWLNKDQSHMQEFLLIREYWETPVEMPEITMPEIAFERFKEKQASATSRSGFTYRAGKWLVAASIALLVGSAVVLLVQKYTPPSEIYTYMCQDGNCNFRLPDGSIVHLNKNSQLSYSDQYNEKDRQVKLDGEAYFEIARAAQLFRIDFGQAQIEVFGTKFNVQAYSGDNQIITTLEEGSVQFITADHQIKMIPGQQLSFFKDRSVFDLREVETELYTVWKEKLYKYRGVTMQELCTELEARHTVKIDVAPRLKNIKVSGSFGYQQSIEQILGIMIKSLPFEWKRNGDTITIY